MAYISNEKRPPIMKTLSVYLVTNVANGKRYVGQTRQSLSARWRQHKSQRSSCVRKHGVNKFVVELLFEVPTAELANELEAECIRNLCTIAPNGYNLTTGGAAPQHSPQTRAKLSRSLMGRKLSAEHVGNISKSLIGNKHSVGRVFSAEHRMNLSRARRNVLSARRLRRTSNVA